MSSEVILKVVIWVQMKIEVKADDLEMMNGWS